MSKALVSRHVCGMFVTGSIGGIARTGSGEMGLMMIHSDRNNGMHMLLLLRAAGAISSTSAPMFVEGRRIRHAASAC